MIQPNYTLVRNSISNIIRVFLEDSTVTTGAGLVGLSHVSTGLSISTLSSAESSATNYTAAGSTIEAIAALGSFATPTAGKCRFSTIDATNQPGMYELHIANARFGVANSRYLDIFIKGAPNLRPCAIRIFLVDYDPYDPIRMGMTGIPYAAADSPGGLASEASMPSVVWQPLTSGGEFGISGSIGKLLKDAVPNAAPGTSGGLFLCGTNTGTITISDGLLINRSSSNTSAVVLTGNGTGHGLHVKSGAGATGYALFLEALSTNGYGLVSQGTGNGHGSQFGGGSGSGYGIYAFGQGSAPGAAFVGGSSGGVGLLTEGGGTGHGIHAKSGAGATGNGVYFQALSTNGYGLAALGTGANSGLYVVGGASNGNGAYFAGVGTGNGIYAISGGGASGSGIYAVSTAVTSGHGISSVGSGTGAGIYAGSGLGTGSAGIYATNNSSSGYGMICVSTGSNSAFAAIALGTGHGIQTTGAGGGNGINATGGGTGHGAYFISGNGATGSGIYAVSDATNGYGIAGVGKGTGSGIAGVAIGTGHGIEGAGAGTGHGAYLISGNGATGDGIRAIANSTNGNGMTLTKTGTGKDFNAATTNITDLASIVAKTAQLTFSFGAVYAVTDSGASIAPALTALSTVQWTNARAGYLDNVNVGGAVASQADVNALNQSASRRVVLQTLSQYERPESGSTAFQLELRTYDGDGAAVNADSTPTLTATGLTTGSLAGNLGSSSNPATGVYRWTYTATSTDTLEQIRFEASATIATVVFTMTTYSQVCDFVAATFNTSDRSQIQSIYNKLPSATYLAGTGQSDGTRAQVDVRHWVGTGVGTIAGGGIPANVVAVDGTTTYVSLINTGLNTGITGLSAAAAATALLANGVASQTTLAAVPNAAANAAAILAAGDVDGFSIEETLKLILSALVAKLSGRGTATITIRAADDSKDRITASVDATGRTSVTLDATG